MNRYAPQISDRCSAEWLAGYRAALADLDAALASIASEQNATVARFVHARLAAQLVQRQSGRAA
jgi:hypothetical protein